MLAALISSYGDSYSWAPDVIGLSNCPITDCPTTKTVRSFIKWMLSPVACICIYGGNQMRPYTTVNMMDSFLCTCVEGPDAVDQRRYLTIHNIHSSVRPHLISTIYTSGYLKCLWSKKKLLLIWKAFSSIEECRFSFQRYLRFCELSVTSLVVSIKQHNTQSRRSLEILKRCSSNLASGLYITKEAKWHLSYRCHDNVYAAGPVLIKTKIPRFYPKRGSSTHNNL